MMRESPGWLYKVTFLAVKNHCPIRAEERVWKKNKPSRSVTVKGKVTIGEGRQILIDEHKLTIWTSYDEAHWGQTRIDPRNEFYVLSQISRNELRSLLNKVFGMNTKAVVLIESFIFNGGTIHIG